MQINAPGQRAPTRQCAGGWIGLVALALCALAGATTAGASCPANAPADAPLGTYRSLSIAVPGLEFDPVYGDKSAFIYVPSTYRPGQAIPLFIVLHGTAGNPTAAMGQASVLQGLWANAAEAGGFIVAAPAASGGQGSWIAPINETDLPSDYDVILALSERLSREYSIDPARRYLWGFSSGGHVTLDIALNHAHRHLTSAYFAGFGVNAGVSAGLACAGLNAALCASQVFAPGTSKRPIDVHIGDADPLWSRAVDDRGRFLANGWQEGVTFFWHPFSGGHQVPSDQPRQIWNNLCGFRNRAAQVPVHAAIPLRLRVDSQANPGAMRVYLPVPSRANPGLRPQERKR